MKRKSTIMIEIDTQTQQYFKRYCQERDSDMSKMLRKHIHTVIEEETKREDREDISI